MQADEFEKKIQSKMQGFELVPGDEVWTCVAIRIEKEKSKRRALVYWLVAALVLLSAGTSYWLLNDESSRVAAVRNNNMDNLSKTENYKIKLDTNVFRHDFAKLKKMQAEKRIVFIKKASTKPVRVAEIKTTAYTQVADQKVVNKAINAKQEKADENIRFTESITTKPFPLHRFYNPALTAAVNNDSALKGDAFARTPNTKKTAFDTKKEEKTTGNKAVKKWKAGFNIYSGVSNNISAVLRAKKTYQQAYPASSGNYDYSSGFTPVSGNFKSSTSWGLGIFLKKMLTAKIGLTAGVDYHLYKATSVVGNKVTGQRVFYDSLLEESISISNFYAVGNSVKYVNKYQLFELPVNILLQLNKNSKKPLILLAGGVAPAYLINSNALYANSAANVYYADQQKLHHFMLSAQSSLMLPVFNSDKYFLSAGPAIQLSINNIARATTAGSQHLFFAGLKVNLFLQ